MHLRATGTCSCDLHLTDVLVKGSRDHSYTSHAAHALPMAPLRSCACPYGACAQVQKTISTSLAGLMGKAAVKPQAAQHLDRLLSQLLSTDSYAERRRGGRPYGALLLAA